MMDLYDLMIHEARKKDLARKKGCRIGKVTRKSDGQVLRHNSVTDQAMWRFLAPEMYIDFRPPAITAKDLFRPMSIWPEAHDAP